MRLRDEMCLFLIAAFQEVNCVSPAKENVHYFTEEGMNESRTFTHEKNR